MATDPHLAHLESALARLAEAQARTEHALATLADRVDDLATQVAHLTKRMDQLVGLVGNMRGPLLELDYRQHAPAYFAPFLRRVHEVPAAEVERLADEAEYAGRLTESEHQDLVRADLVLRGEDRQGRVGPTYLVVEISAVVDTEDVERAARRAQLLEKAEQRPTRAVVAGERISTDVMAFAQARGVFFVENGRARR